MRASSTPPPSRRGPSSFPSRQVRRGFSSWNRSGRLNNQRKVLEDPLGILIGHLHEQDPVHDSAEQASRDLVVDIQGDAGGSASRLETEGHDPSSARVKTTSNCRPITENVPRNVSPIWSLVRRTSLTLHTQLYRNGRASKSSRTRNTFSAGALTTTALLSFVTPCPTRSMTATVTGDRGPARYET